MSRTKSGILTATALAMFAAPQMASAQTGSTSPLRTAFMEAKAGTTIDLYGHKYVATENTIALTIVSSEYFGVAVLSGRVEADKARAGPGDILVTPIEQVRTRRYIFDAAALARSLDTAQLARVDKALDTIASLQKRQRFFGRLEQVGVNLRAPGTGLIESFRSVYMAEPAIVDIRRRAKGDAEQRRWLTAETFATALAAGDTKTVAALLDPKPFTDVSIDPQVWQSARTEFAARIIDNGGKAGAGMQPVALSDPLAYSLDGKFTLRLVDRDRATFVAALEPVS